MPLPKRVVISLVFSGSILACAPIAWYLNSVEQETLPRSEMSELRNHAYFSNVVARDLILLDTRENKLSSCTIPRQGWGAWNAHYMESPESSTVKWDLSGGIPESELVSRVLKLYNKESIPGRSVLVAIVDKENTAMPNSIGRDKDFHIHMGSGQTGWLVVDDKSDLCDRNILDTLGNSFTKLSMSHIDDSIAHDAHVSQAYQLTFSLLVSENINTWAGWDIESALEQYMKPFLSQIEPISNFSISSQVLYHSRIGNTVSDGVTGADFKNFLTVNDWKIQTNADSAEKEFHFMLYIDVDANQTEPIEYASSVLVPRWGGVVTSSLKDSSPSKMYLDAKALQPVLARFTGHLRNLIGLSDCSTYSHVSCEKPRESGIAQWELDGLMQQRAQQFVEYAADNLHAIVTLVDEIPHMPIASRVLGEIQSTMKVLKQLQNAGQLDVETMQLAKEAAKRSRMVYYDPSLIPQLYFPPEYLYAVYLPLLAPMVLPLVSGLKFEYNRYRRKSQEKLNQESKKTE